MYFIEILHYLGRNEKKDIEIYSAKTYLLKQAWYVNRYLIYVNAENRLPIKYLFRFLIRTIYLSIFNKICQNYEANFTRLLFSVCL